LKLEFDIKLMAVGQISPLQSLFHEKMFGSPGGRSSYWLNPSFTSCQEAVLISDSWPGMTVLFHSHLRGSRILFLFHLGTKKKTFWTS